jgi:hypothetical protein
MEGSAEDLLDEAWSLTVFANPQVLSLLGQGWTYREILRVNTLSSRRVRVDKLSPRQTVLSLKRRLEDMEGVAVEEQELRRVNLDGATELIMRDDQQLHETGVRNDETIFWVTAKDGDVSLFSAGSNSDGCRMANSAGSEVLTEQIEEGGAAAEPAGNWWEREGSSSGVLGGRPPSALSSSRTGVAAAAAGAAAAAPAVAAAVGELPDTAGAGGPPSPAERARVAQATEARAARLAAMHDEEEEAAAADAAAGAASAESASSPLAAGRRVKISGLNNPKSQHLNRTHATILEYLPELQRYSVQLDGGAGKAKLKMENLEPIKPPPRCGKTSVLRWFLLKPNYLPRQVQDKHGKIEKRRFCRATTSRNGRRAHQPKIARGEEATGEVGKTAIFEPFIYKMHYFTKTGSGQT